MNKHKLGKIILLICAGAFILIAFVIMVTYVYITSLELL
jgi:hypothetical protein